MRECTVELIQLIQERVKLWGHVKTVMNLRVHKKQKTSRPVSTGHSVSSLNLKLNMYYNKFS